MNTELILRILKSFLLLIFLLLSAHSYSQPSDNVRSLSMGRTSVSNTFNLDALNHNPANLRDINSKDSSKVYFSLLSSAGYVLNSDFLTINFYNKFFTGDANGNKKFLTAADKTEILNSSKNTDLGFNLNYKIASLLINTKSGTFGFALEDKLSAKSYISGDLASLTLFGNEIGRTYDVKDFNLNTSWIRQINISYANSGVTKSGRKFSYGVSVKPQLGYYYLGVKKNDLTLYTNENNVLSGTGTLEFQTSNITKDGKVVYPGLTDISGFGVGFDAGVSTAISKKLMMGISVTDIGFINWNKNVQKYTYSGNFVINDLSISEQLDTLRALINATKTPDADFSRSLPTTLRLGATYKFFRTSSAANDEQEFARVSMDLIQGVVKNVAGNTTKTILALGGEFAYTSFLLQRLGMIFGGDEKYTLSAGLGLDTKHVLIDIGTHNILTLFNIKSASKISGGINIKFRF